MPIFGQLIFIVHMRIDAVWGVHIIVGNPKSFYIVFNIFRRNTLLQCKLSNKSLKLFTVVCYIEK